MDTVSDIVCNPGENMSLRVEAYKLNLSDQKTSHLQPGIMSADDIRRVQNIIDGAKAELKAKAENRQNN